MAFRDVAKSAKDLLSKSFNYNNKVELKSKTESGVTFTSEAVVSKPSSASIKAEGAFGGVRVDKLAIGTDKKVAGEFSLPEAFPGTKLTFKATDGSRAAGADAISAVIGAEYRQANATVTADVDAINYGVDSSVLVAYDGFLVGATAKAALGGAGGVELRDYNALLGYKTKEYVVGVQTEKKAAVASAFYYHTISPAMAAAAVAKFPLAPKASASAFDVELGLSYRTAPDTVVTAKVGSSGKAAASYAVQVNPLTKITFATEVDAANIASDDHKMGITLAITQ